MSLCIMPEGVDLRNEFHISIVGERVMPEGHHLNLNTLKMKFISYIYIFFLNKYECGSDKRVFWALKQFLCNLNFKNV